MRRIALVATAVAVMVVAVGVSIAGAAPGMELSYEAYRLAAPFLAGVLVGIALVDDGGGE